MGLAVLPKWLIEADLDAGNLVQVLPERNWPAITLYGVYPSRKFLSLKVRTFLDFLLDDAGLA
jgi:DNA-binding transcriptional LysR family regulator